VTVGSAGGRETGAIYDRGYRHYDGPRESRSRAIKALYWAGIRRALGIKRAWRTKIVPILLFLIAFAPAVAYVGIRVLVGEAAEELTSFGVFMRDGWLALLLFAATAGPEVLCPDRRSRVLTLVFTRPVTRLDYLVGKLAALLTLMAIISIGPLLLVFVGYALTEPNGLAFIRDNLDDLVRIVLGGALLAVFYSVVSLALASLTELRAIATASFLGLFLASTAIANTLFFASDRVPGRRFLPYLSLGELQTRFADWLFGNPVFEGDMGETAGVDPSGYVVAILVVTALAGVLLAWRTRRLSA
jgi:ABC-2 type transport system permease protein